MNKKEFIESVAEMNDMPKKDVLACVDAIFETIKAVLVEGDSIAFQGFGTFSTIERAARKGRNPQTGKAIKIAASTAPKFKASAALKEALK